ncbi:MAG: hypothetical protein KC713_04080, partial [Candidatus Omnitrophica bacterium]|nr:hypothetical protein [Candidatus Omnitrophota bacterium]
MTLTVVITVVTILFIAGIFLLSGSSPLKQENRLDYLYALQKLLGGEICPIEGREDSHQLNFIFNKLPCVIEDVQMQGFNNIDHKTTLRVFSDADFDLNFSENESNARFDRMSGPLMASQWQVSGSDKKNLKVDVPKKLADMNIYSNNPYWANEIFKDPKLLNIILRYKNAGKRGVPFIPLKFVDGWVCLEFQDNID